MREALCEAAASLLLRTRNGWLAGREVGVSRCGALLASEHAGRGQNPVRIFQEQMRALTDQPGAPGGSERGIYSEELNSLRLIALSSRRRMRWRLGRQNLLGHPMQALERATSYASSSIIAKDVQLRAAIDIWVGADGADRLIQMPWPISLMTTMTCSTRPISIGLSGPTPQGVFQPNRAR